MMSALYEMSLEELAQTLDVVSAPIISELERRGFLIKLVRDRQNAAVKYRYDIQKIDDPELPGP
jgi:hypothetical protein